MQPAHPIRFFLGWTSLIWLWPIMCGVLELVWKIKDKRNRKL
jgi:hypothetical protein